MTAFLEPKLEAQELNSKISLLGNQVALLETHKTELKKSLFSIEKLRVYQAATRLLHWTPNLLCWQLLNIFNQNCRECSTGGVSNKRRPQILEDPF